MGSDGNPVIAYAFQSYCPWGPPDPGVVYLYQGGSSTEISGDEEYSTIDMSIGPDGFGRVVFDDAANSDTGEAPAINFVQCTNASCSSFATSQIATSSMYTYPGVSVAVEPDGTPLVQLDDGEGDSYYIVCTTQNCSSYSTQVIPDMSGNSLGLASLAIGSDGVPSMIAAGGDNMDVVESSLHRHYHRLVDALTTVRASTAHRIPL